MVKTLMIYRKIVLSALRPLSRGALEVELPDRERLRFGGLDISRLARLRVVEENFFRRCVLYGPIGFAESYMDGEWETPDLVALLGFFILNFEEFSVMARRGHRGVPWMDVLAFSNRLAHWQRPNSRKTSRRNISDHYDLSNEFFSLWLDPTMTYSCAFFESEGATLEAAQLRKYEKLCAKLKIQPSDRVLEIGTGWGGFAIHAASRYGCRVTSITISEKQFEEARRRVAEAGVGELVEVRLEDYRDVRGTFDKVVSIEMIEAVGDRYVDGYFEKIAGLLAPHGLVGIQAILTPDQQYETLRRGVDFIQKHIFPGSLLMSLQRILQATSRTDGLNLLDYEDMAPHYAKTLRLWRENFEAKAEAILALGFDEKFMRKWRYYLCYCEAAFAMRFISVAQIVFSRPCNLALNRQTVVGELPMAMPLR